MKKLKYTKRLLAAVLSLTMIFSLSGCGKEKVYTQKEASSTKAMVVGEYDVYLDEMILYAMQVVYLQGYTTASWSETIESASRETVLSLIRENKILYDIAIKNNTTLNDSDKEYVQTTIDKFKHAFGKDIFKQYGISDEVIDRVFEEQAVITKFENDMKNQLGQTIQADFDEVYKDYDFHSIYYMLFPTVVINEADEPTVDENGKYVYVSDAEKEDVLAKANEAIAKIKDGADCKEVAEEYGITNYSSERVGYVGAYADDLNKMLEGLETGECTEVFEDTLGYVVVVVTSAHDEELKSNYVYNLVSETVTTEYDSLRNMWLGTVVIDETKDIIGTAWADFDFAKLVKHMEEAGAASAK